MILYLGFFKFYKGENRVKILKQVSFSIVTILLITIFIIIIQLFLKSDQENMFLLLSFLMIVIITIGIISKRIKISFLQGRFGAVLLVLIVIFICINIVILTMFNMALSDVLGKELTASEKLGFYKESFDRAIKRNNYTEKINVYSESMNNEEFEYITFYFNDNIDKKYINAAKKSLSKAEDSTEEILGNLEKENLKVILYDNDEEFKQNTDIAYDIYGFYDGIDTIHLDMSKYEDALQPMYIFEDSFIHEYSHYIWRLYIDENDLNHDMPLWFEEGVAEYIKNTGVLVEYPEGSMIKMEELNKMNTQEDFLRLMIDKDYDPYSQSYYAIDSLIEMKGINIITDILNKSKERDFYEAFSIATGMEVEEFQNIFIPKYIENYERRIEKEIEMMNN